MGKTQCNCGISDSIWATKMGPPKGTPLITVCYGLTQILPIRNAMMICAMP